MSCPHRRYAIVCAGGRRVHSRDQLDEIVGFLRLRASILFTGRCVVSIINTRKDTRSAQIRARLDHPIIDAYGHLCEHMPTFLEYLRHTAGSKLTREFVQERHSATWQALSQEARRLRRVWRPSWWSYPSKNTLEWATTMIPTLLRERMDDFGIDFMIAYTSIKISLVLTARNELRQAGCKALNKM